MKNRKINCLVLAYFMFSVLIGGCQNKTEKSSPHISINQKIPFDFPDFSPPVFQDNIFDIRNYGAKANDSTFVNTEAIKKAVTACNFAGGGTVLVPNGTWHTGPIHLKSNVNLHLNTGAELRFSKKYSDYLPVVLMQRGGFFCYNYSPLVYAKNCQNIAITGSGLLNGQGQAWWPWKNRQPGMVKLFQMGKAGVPVEERVFGTEKDGVRPPFIQFIECKDIILEDVTFKDGPSWNIHPVFCENVIIRKVTVSAHGPNNDGIDPDGCKNVLIEDCDIDVGDDNICLKSGRDEEAWAIGRPCENVVVRRCTTKAGHGGFVIGSEMSADVRNVLVEDCSFSGTDKGLRFKSRPGRRGVVENIWVRNITMENIQSVAIDFNMNYNGEPIEKAMQYGKNTTGISDPPVFRNFHIEDINCTNAKIAIRMVGLPGDYLKDIHFSDVTINSKEGFRSQYANDLSFQNVSITSVGEVSEKNVK
jgi:polygalacturonase